MKIAHRSPLRASLALLAAGALGCAHAGALPAGMARRELRLSEGEEAPRVRIDYPRENEVDASLVARAIENVLPVLREWGSFSRSVTIRLYSDHAALEAAVGRYARPWMRAWARPEEIALQAPSSWGERLPGHRQLEELLLHELTHSLMYQLASKGDEWQRKRIPFWFREGMASVVAGQGYRRSSLPELSREAALRDGPLLGGTDTESRREMTLNYSLAHHAFAWLLELVGQERIQELLAELRRGQRFDAPFERATGLTPNGFDRAFRAWLVGETWR